MATWIFLTASIFLEVVIRMNMIFFSFAFLIGSERGFVASFYFIYLFLFQWWECYNTWRRGRKWKKLFVSLFFVFVFVFLFLFLKLSKI